MLAVWNGHDDGIDIFAIQNFFVISRGRNLPLQGFLRSFVAAVVQIANGDTFGSPNGERCREKFEPRVPVPIEAAKRTRSLALRRYPGLTELLVATKWISWRRLQPLSRRQFA